MTEDKEADVIRRIERLPAKERAAALAHWIYVRTTQRDNVDWALRVDDAWGDLDPKARDFNLASIDTWGQSPHILAAWIEAVAAYQSEISNVG